MKYQLVIFDLDGTILDTLEDLYLSTCYALKQSGFPERTLDEVRQFVGNGIRKLTERAVPAGTPEEAVQKTYRLFTEYYTLHCTDNTKPYDGIPEVLQQLRQTGIKTAVISNKADNAVQILCRNYFPGLFDAVSGERQGIPRKPAPDSVRNVLHLLQIPAESAVYVGDSDVDIRTARNAGIPCISAAWGFRSRDFLLRHGAQNIISRPEELPDLIKK